MMIFKSNKTHHGGAVVFLLLFLLGHSLADNVTVAPTTGAPQTNATTATVPTTVPPQTNATTTAGPTTVPPQTNATTTIAITGAVPSVLGKCVTPAKNLTRNLAAVHEKEGKTGNLRASHRSLNGWFACGNTHCIFGRATCAVDANDVGTCTCMSGLGGELCEPVNECETSFPCPGGSVCVDMDPSMRYKCACKKGYTPFLPNELPDEPDVPLSYRPVQCIDIIECEDTENPPCHPDATCFNTIGGFECLCNGDFEGNGITVCEKSTVNTVDVIDDTPDEFCLVNETCKGSNMQCLNTTCSCLPGFAQVGPDCQNITDPTPDEPDTPTRPEGFCLTDDTCKGSNMQCVDNECSCRLGYAKVGPNCQNEVHCDASGFNNDCHRRATCTEEDGFPGFACTCIAGWEDAFEGANGKACRPTPPPETDPPPVPDGGGSGSAGGVGPHPNRPTVFRPQCLADGAVCGNGIADTCCGLCAIEIIKKEVVTTPPPPC